MSTLGWTREIGDNRLEDLDWMYETGETAAGAAERLGLPLKSLDKWARRNAVPFWSRMLARDPRDWNSYEMRRSDR